MARLGDLCRFINGDRGKNYPSQTDIRSNGDVPFINAGHIVDGQLDFSDMNYISKEKYDQLNSGKVQENDILYCLRGSLGKKAIVKDVPIGAIASSLVIIRPNNTKVSSEYLYFALESPTVQEQMLQANNGSSQPNLSAKSVSDYVFALPDLETQNMIVSKIQAVNKLIALRKEQLAKLDQLVKSRFVEMFGDCLTNPRGWKTKFLEEISEVGSSKRVFVEELKTTGIPFYRGTEVGALAEGKQITPELYITEEHYSELCAATGAPQIGDLLMPSICPDGRIWVVNTEEPFYFKDGRVLWVHAIDKRYNPTFLLYTLKDRIMTDYSSIASGTTFAELKIFALKKCQIFDVPIALQNQFVDFIEQTNKSKLTIQASLDKLELLTKSLMQQYFG